MGREPKKQRLRKNQHHMQNRTRTVPNWPLLSLALLGMVVAGYLTATAWIGHTVAGCSAGGGCDQVLSSPWAKFLGLPTAFWGFLLYLGLAGIAWIKDRVIHWKLACLVSLFGVLYSASLTTVSLVRLKAACPYCLASAAVMATIFGVVIYQRPKDLPDFSLRAWLLQTIAASLVLIAALHLYHAGVLGKAPVVEDPKVRALVEHLIKTDAKFYGADWCPHCQEQKKLFGGSADHLPYIECSPYGRGAPQATTCDAKMIHSYPTWIINGRRYERVLTLREVAAYSGFDGAF